MSCRFLVSQILSGHSRAPPFAPEVGDHSYPARCGQDLGYARAPEGEGGNQWLPLPHLALSQPRQRPHHDRKQAHAGERQSRSWAVARFTLQPDSEERTVATPALMSQG
jgi:hypothetical protein